MNTENKTIAYFTNELAMINMRIAMLSVLCAEVDIDRGQFDLSITVTDMDISNEAIYALCQIEIATLSTLIVKGSHSDRIDAVNTVLAGYRANYDTIALSLKMEYGIGIAAVDIDYKEILMAGINKGNKKEGIYTALKGKVSRLFKRYYPILHRKMFHAKATS